MTRREICETLGVSYKMFWNALEKATAESESIRTKRGIDKQQIDYSLDECLLITSKLANSRLMSEYIRENYIEHTDEGYNIPGTKRFLERWKSGKFIKCCNTCRYCIGRIPVGKSVAVPFCNIYNRYLHNFDADVYEDWCSSYEELITDKPRMWLRKSAPVNINLYGETDKVNGIRRDEFKSSEETRRNETPVILGKTGFDY